MEESIEINKKETEEYIYMVESTVDSDAETLDRNENEERESVDIIVYAPYDIDITEQDRMEVVNFVHECLNTPDYFEESDLWVMELAKKYIIPPIGNDWVSVLQVCETYIRNLIKFRVE